MGKPFYVSISGIKEVRDTLRQIDKYDADVQAKLRNAVKTSTDNVAMGARRRVHVRSGKLIKGIQPTYDANTNVGEVHAKSPHAHLVEFGHKGTTESHKRWRALHAGRFGHFAKVDIPDVKPHPFLTPALEAEKSNLIKEVTEAVKET
jgi:hypothetical protein